MTDPWAKFWIAISLMVLSGFLMANLVIGSPIEVGALAQWVAAGATVFAIAVALKNTQATLDNADRREASKQQIADKVYITAVISLAVQVSTAIDILKEHVGGAPKSKEILSQMLRLSHIDGLVGSIDRMPLHTVPDPILVGILTNIRISAKNSGKHLELAVESEKSVSLSFDAEAELMEQMVDQLRAAFPDEFEVVQAEILKD